MTAFIDDHRGDHGVEPICKVLPIAPSTYHCHAARRADPSKLSARAKRDLLFKPEIERVFKVNFEIYGVRKVWRQLQREGFDVARCTVARLMRNMGLQRVILGKPVRTTISDMAAPCPLDHVNRQFKALAPNRLWVSDYTYVSTWKGFVYVAFVIDVYTLPVLSDGAPVERHTPHWFLMPLSRLCTIAVRHIAAGWFIIATAAVNTCPLSTLNGWLKRALNHLLEVLEIHMTTLWQKPSTASTKLR